MAGAGVEGMVSSRLLVHKEATNSVRQVTSPSIATMMMQRGISSYSRWGSGQLKADVSIVFLKELRDRRPSLTILLHPSDLAHPQHGSVRALKSIGGSVRGAPRALPLDRLSI